MSRITCSCSDFEKHNWCHHMPREAVRTEWNDECCQELIRSVREAVEGMRQPLPGKFKEEGWNDTSWAEAGGEVAEGYNQAIEDFLALPELQEEKSKLHESVYFKN